MCNMQCKYCFYYDVSNHRSISNYGVMSAKTTKSLIMKALVLKMVDEINFAFQGGEPLLAGIDYFNYFIDTVNRYKSNQKINYSLQTNGTLINEEFIELFKKNRFLIGISLDGFKENHDYFRIFDHHKGSYNQIMKTIELLRNNEIEFNVLSVLTSQLSKEPKKLYDFYKTNKFEYIQLIPCLADLNLEELNYALKPQEFSNFYKSFFDSWYKDNFSNRKMSITLFDNLLMMIMGYYPQLCGMLGQCTPQFVVESNGDVFCCDFYVLDKYKIGNIQNDSIESVAKSSILTSFINESKQVCNVCLDCPFENICHKNCKRMNHSYFTENYCGYREFLEYSFSRLSLLASTY